jgi:peptidoglycan/xylan/chitin deacetylase (PgdA/CDA1 family)
MRELCFLLLRCTGVPFLLRELHQRRRLTILVYHDPPADAFDRHLVQLKSLYRIIPLRLALDALAGRAPLPPKALVLTLDDGHRGNADLIPEIRRRRVPVTIFLCSSIVGTAEPFWFKTVDNPEWLKRLPDEERLSALAGVRQTDERQALSCHEVELMRSEIDFQSHTATHALLPRCRDHKAEAEIAGSKHDLEERFGFDIYAIAYPNGDYSPRDAAFARDAGYRCALTVDWRANGRDTDLFALRRLNMSDGAGPSELVMKASGLWALLRLVRDKPYGLARTFDRRFLARLPYFRRDRGSYS